MPAFKQPLAVYFVWHPADDITVSPLVEYCFDRFQRDTKKPFSRNLNLPVFFRTSSNNHIPIPIASKAEKTVVICFSNKHVTGDANWRGYFDTFKDVNNQHVIAVAITAEFGFGLNNKYKNDNFMRLYDFEKTYIKQQFFISVTHEISRFAFNRGGTVPGHVSAIKLFLSHTKHDQWAVETAKSLKEFIDKTSMHRFFDVHDVHISHEFGDEIEMAVADSTLISIQSDNYSSRYWCQKEILIAKERMQPIIAVNHFKTNEDRIFPHAVNVPSIRVESIALISANDIHTILEAALLETLRTHYNKQLLEVYSDSTTIILTRPPELTDIPNILLNHGSSIQSKVARIIYPEPPVYGIELKCFNPTGIRIETPLTTNLKSFKNILIGITISDPDIENVKSIGHGENHLISLSQTIARHLLFRDATMVYGGDLRPNGFTQYLCEEAKIVQDRIQDSTPLLENYSAWPIYTNEDEPTLDWNAKYNKVMKIIQVEPPEKVKQVHDIKTFLRPVNPINCFAWCLCLSKMRNEMINKCRYRISAGGKLSGYKGKYPGVLEEIIISIRENKPLYLIGGFGGITSKVCELFMGKNTPEELTMTWQLYHNAGYKELTDLFSIDPDEENIDYNTLVGEIKKFGIPRLSNNNGLTEDQNKTLFSSEYIDEIIMLILEGINNIEGCS